MILLVSQHSVGVSVLLTLIYIFIQLYFRIYLDCNPSGNSLSVFNHIILISFPSLDFILRIFLFSIPHFIVLLLLGVL